MAKLKLGVDVGGTFTDVVGINEDGKVYFAGFLIRFRPNYKGLYKGFYKYYFRCDLNRKYFVKEMNLSETP